MPLKQSGRERARALALRRATLRAAFETAVTFDRPGR